MKADLDRLAGYAFAVIIFVLSIVVSIYAFAWHVSH
jgi:hypothetical protein